MRLEGCSWGDVGARPMPSLKRLEAASSRGDANIWRPGACVGRGHSCGHPGDVKEPPERPDTHASTTSPGDPCDLLPKGRRHWRCRRVAVVVVGAAAVAVTVAAVSRPLRVKIKEQQPDQRDEPAARGLMDPTSDR